jgi:hypothetical protein
MFSMPSMSRTYNKGTSQVNSCSLSWHQARWGSWPKIFFLTLNPYGQSLCNVLSDERLGLSLMSMLGLCQVYVPHIQHVTENVSFCTIFKSRSQNSVVGIATSYSLDDREVRVRVPVGSRIYSSPNRPDRIWGPPNFLSNGYQGLFPRG